MMASFRPAHVAPIHASTDEIAFCAWVAQAAPGETLVYHRGFLAVDTFGSASPLSPERRSTLRRTADAALRAAEQDLVHLVQARIGPDQFAYIAVARRKPHKAGASLSMRLLEAA
ncbi:hypothetical protein [Pseudorhodobacter antarcticus]|nr:hypothetical protein [Pseudorhodobacter antarcticus]